MIVLDTHAWYWWRTGSRTLSARALNVIEGSDKVIVPAICCWEMAMLVELGRLRFDRSIQRWLTDALDHERIEQATITPTIAVRALDVRRYFGGGDPVDHLIAGTALAFNAPLVSADEELATFPGLESIW
jgi:PIN domain nuclease of toxin-antitoxin system